LLGGSGGLAGEETVKIIQERGLLREPGDELVVLKRKPLLDFVYRPGLDGYAASPTEVDTRSESFDLAILALPAEASREYAPRFVACGVPVIDYSEAYREDPANPLVVVGVNDDALGDLHGIICNPNCATMQVVIALKPILDAVGIEKLRIAAWQAVSGAGRSGLAHLGVQQKGPRERHHYEPMRDNDPFPHPIADNVIAQVGSFQPGDDRSSEERKIAAETRRILDADIPMKVFCSRVPIARGHSLLVEVKTTKELSADGCRELLGASPGLLVSDLPGKEIYPQPLAVVGRDEVYVGRIQDVDPAMEERSLSMWIVADNLRVGVALNGVRLAELLRERNLLRRVPA
jgi:aspartate-semialdehyde dehydrogenase